MSIRTALPKNSSLHDLKALFLALPQQHRDAIETQTRDTLPPDEIFIFAQGPTTQDLYIDIAPGLPSMVDWLERARLSFEVWRYHYESETIPPLSTTALRCFAVAVGLQLRNSLPSS